MYTLSFINRYPNIIHLDAQKVKSGLAKFKNYSRIQHSERHGKAAFLPREPRQPCRNFLDEVIGMCYTYDIKKVKGGGL